MSCLILLGKGKSFCGMLRNTKLSRLILNLLLFCTGLIHSAEAQEFEKCEQLLKRLLPVFNRSFEDNNPHLIRTSEYRLTLIELQKAFKDYHKKSYLSSDSLQRINNEAVLMALGGSYSKAYYLIESMNAAPTSIEFRYNRGLIRLLNKQYAAARNDLEENTASGYAPLNVLVAYGQEGQLVEGVFYSSNTAVGNTGGKWDYNRGVLLKQDRKFEEALNEFSAAVRRNDDLVAFRLQRGDMLMRLGRDKQAVNDFERIATRHPRAQIRYANALLSLERFWDAHRVFENYLASGDRLFKSNAYLGMGHANYGLKDLTKAQRYYRLAAATSRDDRVAMCGQANVLLSKRDYVGAGNLFNRILQNDSTYLSAYLGRAIVRYGKKNYDLALADFKKAELLIDETRKSMPDVFVSRGFSHYYTQNPTAAKADFERAVKLDPTRYEALAGISGVLIDRKNYAEAGQFLAKALNYEKGYDKMWSNYGNLQLHFDMYSKSYESFRRARALNPGNLKAQNGWGIVLLERDQMDQSIALFDSLIKENRDVSFLLNNRGIVQAYLANRHIQRQQKPEADERFQKAFDDFNKAMEVAPARKFYNVNQGNIYRYWGQYDEAKLSYQAHQDKSAMNNTAVMYAGMEQEKDAKYYLGVALQIDSTYRVFQYNMALLMKGNQKEMAKALASARDGGPYSDISIKYSRDGFVTIYLYDYEYDTLQFPGRHYLPLPVDEYNEDFFIPEFDLRLIPYEEKERVEIKEKKPKYKDQKVKMPGRRGGKGTDCPVF
jgi:tetratricopeptide (TPR) repeat protein